MAKRGPVARLYDSLHTYAAQKAASWGMRALGAKTGEQAIARMWPSGGAGAGGPGAWQFERIEQVRHYRHWVYTCVDFLATQVSSVPPQVAHSVDPDEKKLWDASRRIDVRKAAILGRPAPLAERKFVSQFVRKGIGGQIGHNEELEYADSTHPLSQLLMNPNGPDTWVTFWREAILFYKLTGVNYTWKVPSEEGNGVAELWNIPAHWMRPVCLGQDRLVDYYECSPWGVGSGASPCTRFEPNEIIEVKDPHPWNKLGAQSPLQANSEIIDQYESIQQARYWSMKNGANVGSILRQTDEESYPDDDTIRRLEAAWLSRYQGEVQFNRPQILPRGLTLDRPPPNIELAFIQSTEQGRDFVIAQAFRLSKTALGITEGVPWATFVGEMRRVIQQVINPIFATFGGTFTERLAQVEYGENLRIFWHLASPQDDQQRLSEWAATPGPAVTPNEYRVQILGLEPLDDPAFDVPLQPAGMLSGGMDDFGEGSAFENPGDTGDSQPTDIEEDFKTIAELTLKARPGLVYDATRHRWVKPGNFRYGTPRNDSSDPGDDLAVQAREAAAAVKAYGQQAVEAAKAVGLKASAIAADLQLKASQFGVDPAAVLGTVDDWATTRLTQHPNNSFAATLGVSPNLAATVASKVIAYGVVKVKQHLAAGGESKGVENENAVYELAAEVLMGMLTELGVPADECPTADELRGVGGGEEDGNEDH